MDRFRIDSHKLIYHVSRVNDWLKGVDIYPIYIEVGLFGGCNHRCIFCAFDYLGYSQSSLSTDAIYSFIASAAEKGVKAILYSGEGEPLLHENIVDVVVFTKKSGLDVALSTNGVLFDKDKANVMLQYLSWIRFSIDAGTANNYSFIHGADKDDFKVVINNITEAVKIRNKNNFTSTIGVQFLLLPHNYNEILLLVKILKNIGVDYLTVKPYSSHYLSSNFKNSFFDYNKFLYLKDELSKYSDDNFKIIFRNRAMLKTNEKKPYKDCLGLPFIAHISADGNVYPCNVFVGKEDFVFGNICCANFEDIWTGKKRKKIMNYIFSDWDLKNCRKSCRIDDINRYLWELKYPNNHVNFI